MGNGYPASAAVAWLPGLERPLEVWPPRIMQNRYVGDIGDYLKLSILRALSPGYRLGVAWWLFPDEAHNGDGRHVGYLNSPDQWRHFNPELFDALCHVVLSGQRNVGALQAPGLIPGAIYADDVIPTGGPIAQRLSARRAWLADVQRALEQANLLFLDPDNGLEPSGYRPTALKSGKSITLSELRELAMPGRCLIVYHHQSRRRGGHYVEMEHCHCSTSSEWLCHCRCTPREALFASCLLPARCTCEYTASC